ncbi:MAG: nucleotidyltransferase domain-containing protein [Thermoanaerobaculia bacterium]
MDIVSEVTSALQRHPAVKAVRLVGSRQQGTAGELSDWDFEIDTEDFEAVARGLADLTSSLQPLAQQWDPLSRRANYMLMLRGGVKVDLIFDRPYEPAPPWKVSAETIPAIDHHFWDWTLWLAAKDSAGKHELVKESLANMSSHMLRPMGVERIPDAIETAVELYTEARRELDERLCVAVSDEIGRDVRRALRNSGYRVPEAD